MSGCASTAVQFQVYPRSVRIVMNKTRQGVFGIRYDSPLLNCLNESKVLPLIPTVPYGLRPSPTTTGDIFDDSFFLERPGLALEKFCPTC